MIAAWMLYSIAVAMLLGGAALAGDRLCRLLKVPVRWVWVSAMVVTLALSAGALVRLAARDAPTNAVPLLELDVREASLAKRPASALYDALAVIRQGSAAAADAGYAMAARLAGGGSVLAASWAIGSTLLLLLVAATLLRLRRARRRWRPHRIGDVSVLVSRSAGPALIGLLRPSIVVPAWLLGETPERQRLVVQHELEHRRSGDHVLLAAATLLVCAVPWNVPLWWMLRRVRLAVELDCDARVLQCGAAARSYGSLLLEVAARTRAFPFSAPALSDSTTHLERRLIAMTEKNRTSGRSRVAACALAAVVLLTAACAADLPTAAAIDELDVAAAQAQAERAGVLERASGDKVPLFLVDGVIVDADEARGIEEREIRTIEVLKQTAAQREYGERGRNGVVSIRTGAADSTDEAVRVQGVLLRKSAGAVELRRSEGVVRERVPLMIEDLQEVEVEGRSGAKPLIVIDGVIMADADAMSSILPESIERIEVVKGVAARDRYDHPRARNGVIMVTTKR